MRASKNMPPHAINSFFVKLNRCTLERLTPKFLLVSRWPWPHFMPQQQDLCPFQYTYNNNTKTTICNIQIKNSNKKYADNQSPYTSLEFGNSWIYKLTLRIIGVIIFHWKLPHPNVFSAKKYWNFQQNGRTLLDLAHPEWVRNWKYRWSLK